MFDFAGYRDAAVALDAERWLSYYAPDAEWTEYRHAGPPRSPHVMRGDRAIGEFLRAVAAEPLRLAFDNEVVGEQRAAYTLVVTRPDGLQIIENVIVEFRGDQIVKQIDVEAWD